MTAQNLVTGFLPSIQLNVHGIGLGREAGMANLAVHSTIYSPRIRYSVVPADIIILLPKKQQLQM